ncbi:uncharacterized protein LOC143287738 [Babylonia areolata]|uniref:uncharacterized protein LOC143287738 n=1 Tax=Babylonia areolata TaxID=304850 RepID=UPI003FD24007
MAQRRLLQLLILPSVVSTLIFAQNVKITTDKYGIVDAREHGRKTVYCCPDDSSNPVEWTLKTADRTILLGTCGGYKDPCTSRHNDTVLKREKSYSAITLNPIQRNMIGNLSCAATIGNTTESDDVILNVYHLPTFDDCRVDIVNHNWSALWSCDVSDLFSSAGLYTLHVQEIRATNESIFDNSWEIDDLMDTEWIRRDIFSLESREPWTFFESTLGGRKGNSSGSNKALYHGQFPIRRNLTSYISTDGKEYFKGRLLYSWRLSSYPANSWTVMIHVCPGIETCGLYRFRTRLPKFSTPSKPRHNCTDLTYLPETGGSRCVCTADHLGSPAGRLMWMMGNTTLAAGQYSVSQLVLPSDTMGRNLGGKLVVCQLDWIQPEYGEPHYVNIAYGPDSVALEVSWKYDANDDWVIVIDCQVTGLNPRTPDMVHWGGPCQGQSGFTCTLNQRETQVQGSTVTCRVTNAVNNGHSAEASRRIDAVFPITPVTTTEKEEDTNSDPVTTTQKNEDTSSGRVTAGEKAESYDKLKWAGIGGAVTLVVVVVSTLLVVAVVWMYRRGHLCTGPVYESTRPKGTNRQSSAEYTHTYDVITVDKNRGRSLPPQWNPDHVYENTNVDEKEIYI